MRGVFVLLGALLRHALPAEALPLEGDVGIGVGAQRAAVRVEERKKGDSGIIMQPESFSTALIDECGKWAAFTALFAATVLPKHSTLLLPPATFKQSLAHACN